MNVPHPRFRVWMDLSEGFYRVGEAGLRALRKNLRARRKASYSTLRPGPETFMWNQLALHLRDEMRPPGTKVRVARYLGIPKQRISDFLAGRRRMPDAETTLRLLHWLAEKRAGRDPSLLNE